MSTKSRLLWSILIFCAAVVFVAQPALAAEKTLKVGAYGGYFKDSFDKHIFPVFTKATGIDVESVAEPTGEAWLVQLEQASKAGVAPADVSMMAQVPRLKGETIELWAPLDLSKMPNSENLKPEFINKYPDGRVSGVGAVTWYINLVTNTKVYPEAPKLVGAMGSRQQGSRGPARPRLQLVPSRDCGEDLFRRHRLPEQRRQHPEGACQDRRAEAERETLVPRRGAVRAGAEIGRDPDGPVLP